MDNKPRLFVISSPLSDRILISMPGNEDTVEPVAITMFLDLMLAYCLYLLNLLVLKKFLILSNFVYTLIWQQKLLFSQHFMEVQNNIFLLN